MAPQLDSHHHNYILILWETLTILYILSLKIIWCNWGSLDDVTAEKHVKKCYFCQCLLCIQKGAIMPHYTSQYYIVGQNNQQYEGVARRTPVVFIFIPSVSHRHYSKSCMKTWKFGLREVLLQTEIIGWNKCKRFILWGTCDFMMFWYFWLTNWWQRGVCMVGKILKFFLWGQ